MRAVIQKQQPFLKWYDQRKEDRNSKNYSNTCQRLQHFIQRKSTEKESCHKENYSGQKEDYFKEKEEL